MASIFKGSLSLATLGIASALFFPYCAWSVSQCTYEGKTCIVKSNCTSYWSDPCSSVFAGAIPDGCMTMTDALSCSDTASCTQDGKPLAVGESASFCEAATVPFGSYCSCISRKCVPSGAGDGGLPLLDGSLSFSHLGCIVLPPVTGCPRAGCDTTDPVIQTPTSTSPCTVAGQIKWFIADHKVKWCDGTAWNDSSGPTGASCKGKFAGKIEMMAGAPVYCDGTNWVSMHVNNSGSCSGVKAGTLKAFGHVPIEMRFCNGTNWLSLHGGSGPAPIAHP
jgi:hypothetical protein